jgi:hypothetical protein
MARHRVGLRVVAVAWSLLGTLWAVYLLTTHGATDTFFGVLMSLAGPLALLASSFGVARFVDKHDDSDRRREPKPL